MKLKTRQKVIHKSMDDTQRKLLAAMFGPDEAEEIEQDVLEMSEGLEKTTAFKTLRKKAEDNLLQLLEDMPPEMVTAEFLDSLQDWVNMQREAMAAQSKAKYKNVLPDSIFFMPLSQSTTIQKTVKSNPVDIFFNRS